MRDETLNVLPTDLLHLDVTNCTKLTVLQLTGLRSDSLKDSGLTHLVKQCSNLQTLLLRGCYKITERGLGKLSALTNLTSTNSELNLVTAHRTISCGFDYSCN